jgi:nitroimidazol reductase NimA-like FMN-containing flavoprotein (pyridoxamine 5'-phosphate oxidase superfamily)
MSLRKLTRKETNFIKQQGVARLATMGPDNMPHNVPVCPVLDREHVYVASEKSATKVRNIEANPKAALVFDLYRDSWKDLRGVMLRCTARVVDEKEFKRIRRKLYAKYPHYEKDAALEPDDSAIIELTPEKKFSWGLG